MNHTYRPSGRISLLFLPASVAALTVAAAAALLCAFGIQASRATLLDMMIYFFAAKCVARAGAFLCVRGGRVRNPGFAGAVGIALAVWYWLLLIGFATPARVVLDAAKQGWKWDWDWLPAFREWFPAFWEPVLSLKVTGAVITGKSGNVLFAMPGTVCVILLGVLFLAAVCQFGFGFWERGRAPFCEASGKWMKETSINLRCQDEETFLSRLLLGDTAVLAELEPLGTGEADSYLRVSVFAADWDQPLYVSVSKMTETRKKGAQRAEGQSGSKPKRCKKPVFQEEQVAEYLALDRGTGFSLIQRKKGD